MLLIVIGSLLMKNRKVATLRTYIAAIRELHLIKGCDFEKLTGDPYVRAIIQGRLNEESMEKPKPKGGLSIPIMRAFRDNLKLLPLKMGDKGVIWMACAWLFLGSLRPSELFGSGKAGEHDVQKTLRWSDLEVVEEKEGNTKVKIVRLTLRQPKTARSSPVQIVEIPQTDGFLCPYKAYWIWAVRTRQMKSPKEPVFTMVDGSMLTTRRLNCFLAKLSKMAKLEEIVTCRDFRGAIPTLLARNGAKSSDLQMLGRWSSSAYKNYIKRGRANNWRQLRTMFSSLSL